MSFLLKKIVLVLAFFPTIIWGKLDSFTANDLCVGDLPGYSLQKSFVAQQTAAGEQKFKDFMNNPLDDISVLLPRQGMVKTLFNLDEKAFNSLKKALVGLAGVQNELSTAFEQASLDNLKQVVRMFEFKSSFLRRLNDSKVALNFKYYLETFSPLAVVIVELVILKIAHLYLAKNEHTHQHGHGHEHGHGGGQASCGCSLSHRMFKGFVRWVVLYGKGIHTLLHIIGLKDAYASATFKLSLAKKVNDAMGLFNNFISRADTLLHELRVVYANGASDFSVLVHSYENLLAEVQSKTKIGSYKNKNIFSPLASVAVDFKSILVLQEQLQQLFDLVGQVDVYLSVAETMRQRANAPLRYCFVDFVDAEKPLLFTQESWLPVLLQTVAPERVRTFSYDNQNEEKGMLLFGDNGVGKSTILRTIGVNVLLAQVFGIAAAQIFSLALFSQIYSFMNVAEDLSKGFSSYIAKRVRAEFLVQNVSNLEQHQRGLFLFDDSLGQATNAKKGTRFALDTVHAVACNPRTLTFTATHMPELSKLSEWYAMPSRTIVAPAEEI